MNRAIANFTTRMLESGVCTQSELVGCTESEISVLESDCKVRLPSTYRTFLATMGRGAGYLAHGDQDFLFDSVASVQNDFGRQSDSSFETNGNLLVSKDKTYTIPQSAFIIFPVYGLPYYFCILCNDPADSPVYYFDVEGDWITLENQYSSLLSFLDMLLAEAIRDLPDSRTT